MLKRYLVKTYIKGMKILGLLLILTIVVGCKKDDLVTNPIPGHYYHVRNDIYGKGEYQPLQPVEYIGLRKDTVVVKAQVDWSKFISVPTNGVRGYTVTANQIRLQTMTFGDTTKQLWFMQIGDLTY